MKKLLKMIKFCWRALNFIRNCVMNLVFFFFVILLAALVGLSSYGSKKDVHLMGDQGALWLNLDGYLADNRDAMSWQAALKSLDEEHNMQISTFDVVYAIENASDDERIQGLVLDLGYFLGGDMPSLTYIGKAIQQFKKSGKPVIAIADNYTQTQYLLASYADKIYLNPIGQVAIQGLAANQLYFKTMLDKLEITPHIFRVGTYKSAVEPFLRDNMSPEARANLQQWVGQMWENYQQIIADNRHIDKNKVLPKASTYLAELKALKGNSTAYSQQRGLVTALATRLETQKQLTALFGENDEGQPKSVDFEDYLAALPDRQQGDDQALNVIAVVNVEGTIIDGESDEQDVGGDTVAKLLDDALRDDRINGVILRVNSPGGSAFASEIIRQGVDNLQQAGKPVVVSMGGMAASGGYWISSTADYVVADKNTITGSIGIFAMFPTFEKTLKKAGISTDGINTSPFAEASVLSPLSKELADIYQLEIEHGYDKFLDVVSKGRKLSKEQVDKIAQGQVWLGQDAYKHKLVDELGDFSVAVTRVGELINKKRPENEQITEFSVQWLVDEDNSVLSSILRDMKQGAKSLVQQSVMEMLGISTQIHQVKQPLGMLSKFNDPKGQYIYCLNCATLN